MTLAIMALLATVALPMAQLAVQRSKESELRSALFEIRDALDAYKKASDEGRIQIAIGESGYPHSIDELVDGVTDQRDPAKRTIYFLRAIPRDPFSIDPNDSAAETWGLRSYESPPNNPQEGDDVFDVHSKSKGVGLNGIPYAKW